MGEYLQQMFGIVVITFLLLVRVCECFPQLNDNKIRGNQILDHMFHEHFSGTENAKSVSTVVKDPYSDNAASDEIKIGYARSFNLKHTEDVLRVFTETSILNILKNYFNNLKSSSKTMVGKSDVIISKGNTTNVIKSSMTTTENQNSVSEAINYKNGHVMPSAVGKQIQTIKVPAPSKSKIDRWLPGLRSYRRKRSYYGDLGLDLESAYNNDPEDIVYGAHTSPCDNSDKHYCLNGGTCVFVGALEIKTCRCRIGYKGLRCESLNQDFLLALLTQGLFI